MKSSSSEKARPRPRAPRLTPEARRAQLLESAMRVFARRGIAAARHAEVASEAGVAVSTTFAYFPTREDLVAAVLESVERVFVELAETMHASDRPAPELLLAHTRAFANLVDDRPDEARVWLNWSSAVGGDDWPRYRAFEDRIGSVVARTIERGQRDGSIDGNIAPKEGARIMIGAAYQIAQMKLSGRPDNEVAPFLDALVRVVAGVMASGLPPELGLV
jgi:TetR/AcrR family hemagglutinin/protease transcriptional regulator